MTNVLDLSRNFCYNNNREVKAKMTRRIREAMASELKLPQHYVELDQQEMMYVDGGDYYISNSVCTAITGTLFAGTYFGAIGIGVAVATGLLTKAAVAGFVYSFVGAVTAANVVLGGLLAVVGTFLLEVAYNVVVASATGRGVSLETIKIWRWDTGIPYSVGLA